MPSKDKLDLSYKNVLDILVDYRRVLVGLIILITVVLSIFIPRLDTDPTLKSGVDSTSPAYLQYEKFIKIFGDEEFILVAIHSKQEIIDSRLLTSLREITRTLEKNDKIAKVISLSNLKLFQARGKLFGNYPVVAVSAGKLHLPDPTQLQTIKELSPYLIFLCRQT